jgi:hypothetical protein
MGDKFAQYTTAVPEGWRTFDDFIQDMTTYRLPATQELAGQKFTFDFTEKRIDIEFGCETLKWSCAGESDEDAYEVVNTAPNVYFLTYLMRSKPTECQVIVFNVSTRRAIWVLTFIKPEKIQGEPRFGQEYRGGVIAGGTPTGMVPHKTKELTGLHAIYTYAEDHEYEHYYITSDWWCSKGLSGVQKGHCFLEPAEYWKFDDHQYVFGWREHIIPCAPVWFIDESRETGSFCNATPEGTIRVEKAGAIITKLVTTHYPNRFEPL